MWGRPRTTNREKPGRHEFNQVALLVIAAVATVALTSVFLLTFTGAPALAFKPAAHQVLLEKVRDSLPQGSTTRQAIQNNFKVANWGSDGPDLGYAYWRVAMGYAPWGDRCHYHLVGSMAAEQLRQALTSGEQWKIAWAAGWLTHVCGDMAVHGVLVNPEAGVYLDGGDHDLHEQLETWAEPVVWTRIGGHSDGEWRSVSGWSWDMFHDLPGDAVINFMRANMQTVYGQAPSTGEVDDWMENFRDAILAGGGVAYDYVTLSEAEQGLSQNGRRAKLDSAFEQARAQSVSLLTAAASGDYSGFTDWWNLDASCTDGRPIGTLTVKIHTANEAFAGTDDDVYFGMATSNDSQRWLLEKEGYNDFEQNDTDEYYLFTARTNFLPSLIRRIWVEKEEDGVGGGWKLGDIDVYVNGQLVYSHGVQQWLQDGHLRWQTDVQWSYLNLPPTAQARSGTHDRAGDLDFFYLDLPAWGNPHHLVAALTSPANTRYLMSVAFAPLSGTESLVWPSWAVDVTEGRTQRIEGNVGPVRIYVMVRRENSSAVGGREYTLTVNYTSSGSTAPAFSDIGGHKYREAIMDVAARGIVGGYADGGFGPNNPVLRAQYAKMISLALHLPVWEDLTFPFTDLGPDDSSSLYPHEYVAAVATAGITQGTTATTFSPWSEVRLAQLVTMTVRAVEDRLAPIPASYTPPFANFDSTHYPYARKAAYYHLLDGFSDSFNWFGSATRGQCALLIHNLLGVLDD